MEAILALLMMGLLNSRVAGDLGTVRTGMALAALDLGMALATAERVKGSERDSKITRGMMQELSTSAGAAMTVEREIARRAEETLLRRRMMKEFCKYEACNRIVDQEMVTW